MKRKIVYIHQYFKFPDESGGTRSYDLSKSFLKEGYEVEVISATKNKKYEKEKGWFTINREGLRIHYIYIPYSNKLPYLKRIYIFQKFMLASISKVLSIKSDVVLATSTPLTVAIPAMLNKWIKKTPFIFEVRDVWPEAPIAIGAINNNYIRKFLYWLERKIYFSADAIIPLSTDMKKSILTRYPILKDKNMEVIENISEVNRFQKKNEIEQSILKERGIPQNYYYILYAGTFGKVNGLEYVLSLALQTLKIKPEIIYILLGDGQEKENIIKLSKDRGLLNNNLFILDPIPKEKLPVLYSEINLGSSFVIEIEELWANSANKFFDTLAAGKPILINHGGWQREVIRQDNIGYVLPPVLDDKSVSDFVKYVNNQELQKTQQANALRKAINSYSLEVAAQKYMSVFNKLFHYV